MTFQTKPCVHWKYKIFRKKNAFPNKKKITFFYNQSHTKKIEGLVW